MKHGNILSVIDYYRLTDAIDITLGIAFFLEWLVSLLKLSTISIKYNCSCIVYLCGTECLIIKI